VEFVSSIKMGNDPELFIKSGNRLLPSESIIKSKHRTVKVDNAAVELQPGPSHCLQMQNKFIASALAVVKKILIDQDLAATHISVRPVERLRLEDIDKYSTVCAFGCQPSLVYDGDGLRTSAPTVNPRKVRFRSVGYHVHIGSSKPGTDYWEYKHAREKRVCNLLHTTEGRVRLVQMCDLFVGLPAVLMERDNRVPIRRKTLGYGKAGEFREQPHGFEYRTLGSWPLLHPMWGWWANGMVRDCLNLVFNDLDTDIRKSINMTKVAEIINEGNLAGALEYWQAAKNTLIPIMKQWGDKFSNVNLADSHPLFSKELLKRFDFLAMKRDLVRRVFNFNSWCKRKHFKGWEGQRLVGFHIGFDNGSKERVKEFEDWPEFSESWSLSKDIISKQMLA